MLMRRPSDFVNEKALSRRATWITRLVRIIRTRNPNRANSLERHARRFEVLKSPENPRRTSFNYSLDLNQMDIGRMDCDPLSRDSNDD